MTGRYLKNDLSSTLFRFLSISNSLQARDAAQKSSIIQIWIIIDTYTAKLSTNLNKNQAANLEQMEFFQMCWNFSRLSVSVFRPSSITSLLSVYVFLFNFSSVRLSSFQIFVWLPDFFISIFSLPSFHTFYLLFPCFPLFLYIIPSLNSVYPPTIILSAFSLAFWICLRFFLFNWNHNILLHP